MSESTPFTPPYSEPALFPYPEPGGEEFTAGHSGSETSRERAERERDSGTLAARAGMALTYLSAMGRNGMTVADFREVAELHHGQASSVLSVLHKQGRIARLKERRDRCQVYVLPEYVNDREVSPYTPNRKNRIAKQAEAVNAVVEAALAADVMTERTARAIRYALRDPDEVLRSLSE